MCSEPVCADSRCLAHGVQGSAAGYASDALGRHLPVAAAGSRYGQRRRPVYVPTGLTEPTLLLPRSNEESDDPFRRPALSSMSGKSGFVGTAVRQLTPAPDEHVVGYWSRRAAQFFNRDAYKDTADFYIARVSWLYSYSGGVGALALHGAAAGRGGGGGGLPTHSGECR